MALLTTAKKIKDLASTEYVKIVLWGKAGTQKTRTACQAPDEDTILISAEKGLLSVRDVAPNMDAIEINTVDELREIVEDLEAYSKHDYEWCIIDSITEIIENMLAQAKEEYNDPRQAYGEVGEGTPDLIKRFRDLEMNVIMIAKSEAITDSEGNVIGYRPSGVWAKNSDRIPYLFDEILHLEPDPKGGVRIRCHPSRGLEIKDRSGNLAEFEKPDLQAIFNKIMQ